MEKKLANIFHNTQTAASVDVFALKKNKMGFLNQQITKKDAGSFFPEFMYRRELFALYTLR